VALTWRPTATLNKRHWVRLQLRFEAPSAIASGRFKWQYIAIIAPFLVIIIILFITITTKFIAIIVIYYYQKNPEFYNTV